MNITVLTKSRLQLSTLGLSTLETSVLHRHSILSKSGQTPGLAQISFCPMKILGKKCINPKGFVIKTLFDFKTMFLRSGFSQFFLWAYMYVHSSITTSKYICCQIHQPFFPQNCCMFCKKSLYFTVAFGGPL